MIIEGAEVKYASLEDAKVIVVGAKVRSYSSGAFIENAEGLITLSEPVMEKNELVTYVKRFELKMETKCFFLSFCIEGSLLENFDSKRLVIAKLSGKIELEVPNCINMANDMRWEPDGSMCPRGTIGRQDSSNKSTRIIPMFDKIRVNIDDYSMTITVPAELNHYNPPRFTVDKLQALSVEDREAALNMKIPDSDYVKGTDDDTK